MDKNIVTEIENFLSTEECQGLIDLINQNNIQSTVSSYERGREVSDFRTSSTSHLDGSNELVRRIHQRIADYLQLSLLKGEPLQGQLYQAGQYFKAHNDYFHPGISYNTHCLSSGNRTHTFMIYLNEGMQGGETDFPILGVKFTPKMGKAISWPNMKGNQVFPPTLHEGCPVTSGNKYIITSWWRENEYDGQKDSNKFKELNP